MSRDVHSCTYSLAETPQLPPSRHIWTRNTRALLVSNDRRHLFVTPWRTRNTGKMGVQEKILEKKGKDDFRSLPCFASRLPDGWSGGGGAQTWTQYRQRWGGLPRSRPHGRGGGRHRRMPGPSPPPIPSLCKKIRDMYGTVPLTNNGEQWHFKKTQNNVIFQNAKNFCEPGDICG